MPREFFREVMRRLPDQSAFTGIYEGDRSVAFALSTFASRVFHAMFCGLDYGLNSRCDLYFNLFFHIMDRAYRLGASEVYCGQTSDTFKHRRLSCSQVPLCGYIKGVRPLAARLIRARIHKFHSISYVGGRTPPHIHANEPAVS